MFLSNAQGLASNERGGGIMGPIVGAKNGEVRSGRYSGREGGGGGVTSSLFKGRRQNSHIQTTKSHL